MNNPDVERFLHKYEARAGLSHQRYHKRPYPYTVSWEDRHLMTASVQLEVEQYVEMLIPQHQFQRLVQYEEDSRDYVASTKHAMEMLEQSRRDEHVRDLNPAVHKAWMKYLMLLELARK